MMAGSPRCTNQWRPQHGSWQRSARKNARRSSAGIDRGSRWLRWPPPRTPDVDGLPGGGAKRWSCQPLLRVAGRPESRAKAGPGQGRPVRGRPGPGRPGGVQLAAKDSPMTIAIAEGISHETIYQGIYANGTGAWSRARTVTSTAAAGGVGAVSTVVGGQEGVPTGEVQVHHAAPVRGSSSARRWATSRGTSSSARRALRRSSR